MVTCEYCGVKLKNSVTHCPHCGGVNSKCAFPEDTRVRIGGDRTANLPPYLQSLAGFCDWCEEHGIELNPGYGIYIGEDVRVSDSMCVYRSGGEFMVCRISPKRYRDTVYQGEDERKAVRLLYEYLCVRMKAAGTYDPVDWDVDSRGDWGFKAGAGSPESGILRKFIKAVLILSAILTAVVVVSFAVYCVKYTKEQKEFDEWYEREYGNVKHLDAGYYEVNGEVIYLSYGKEWFRCFGDNQFELFTPEDDFILFGEDGMDYYAGYEYAGFDYFVWRKKTIGY